MVAAGCSAGLRRPRACRPCRNPDGGRHEKNKLQEGPKSYAENRHDRHPIGIGPATEGQCPPLDRGSACAAKQRSRRVDVPPAFQSPPQSPCRDRSDTADAEGDRSVPECRNGADSHALAPGHNGQLGVRQHLRHLPRPIEAEGRHEQEGPERPQRATRIGHKPKRKRVVVTHVAGTFPKPSTRTRDRIRAKRRSNRRELPPIVALSGQMSVGVAKGRTDRITSPYPSCS